MNEQRLQAYLNLIDALLNCPDGEVSEILNANTDLIDAGLIQKMLEVANSMTAQGKLDAANYLMNLAGNFMGLYGDKPLQKFSLSTSNFSRFTSQRLQLDFLLTVLQATADSNGDPQVVYPLLKKNLDKIDDNLAVVLAEWATAKLQEVESEIAQNIAAVIGTFSNLICQFPLGNRASNLEIAIAGDNVALTVYNRQYFPQVWATIQNNLGIAYRDRIQGEKAENIELAINCYQQALQVYTREAFPQNWAMTHNNLGIAYWDRIQGEKAENIELAINCYQQALQVWTREAFPQNWAKTQNNLGTAYIDRIRGEKAENIELAINCYQQALLVRTYQDFPQDWAVTQDNLGIGYSDRIRGEKAENMELAINCYQQALQIYTPEAFPQDWAKTQNNLGTAYRNRIRGEKAENMELAIDFYQKALLVRTRQAFPQDWAATQNNLGNAYRNRIQGEKAENIELAIKSFQQALLVSTRQAFPHNWAMTQNNLGNAYRNRIQGEKAENIELAIKAFQQALQVRTREAFPQENAETLVNLAITYQDSRQFTAAYNTFVSAIETVELLRGDIVSGDEVKRKHSEEWNQLYLRMVEVCIELHNYTKAIEYADRSKARNLVELIATRDLYPKGEIPEEVQNELQRLKEEINLETRRLANSETRFLGETGFLGSEKEGEDTIYINELRERYNQLLPFKPIQFNDIEKLIDERTAIIEWYITSDKFLAFIIKPNPPTPFPAREGGEEEEEENSQTPPSPHRRGGQGGEVSQTPPSPHRRGGQGGEVSQTPPSPRRRGGQGGQVKLWQSTPKDLESLVNWANKYLRDYTQKDPSWLSQLPQRLTQLAEILHIDEILSQIPPNCDKIILIPHRYLHLFPLHALPLKVPASEEKKKFLLDRFPNGVSYAPNCQLLQQAQNRKRPNFQHLFAIQNPTQDLHYTDLEVSTIQQHFNPSYILAKTAAIKDAISEILLSNTHCAHFSCHGKFNFANPLHSALQLADSPFTLEDIFTSNFSQCRLVTLSACETGLTDFTTNSDEYIGLPSGFLVAGSPSVVSSLWSVYDLSTAFLMIKLYENLQTQPSVPIALNQAQIWLRNVSKQEFLQWTNRLNLGNNWIKEIQVKLELCDLDDTPFAHPVNWAAFCAIGQ